WKTQVLYLPICGSLEEHCQKNSRKKSTGYVKKYDQSSFSGSIYDGSKVMMVMSAEALLDWIIDSGGSVRSESLVGHAVAGELNVSDEEKDSLAQVWHKRLGHISKVGLLVLEKHELFGKKSLRGYGFIFSSSNTKHLESSKSESSKLEPRAVKCIFLGYHEGLKGYRLYRLDDESPKIVTSRNVIFNESVMYQDTLKGLHQEDGDDEDTRDQETDQTTDLIDYQLVQDKNPRTRMKPLRFRDESNMVAYAFVVGEEEDTHESLTYLEVVSCEDISKCKAAMKEEMDSLRKNKT
ncbi:retrovirus-related pol polyprotein from transposon TNT 1-94, partial [Tanacetum coccineum]